MEVKWKMKKMLLRLAFLLVWYITPCVHGHGRLVEPPSRSSMWRFGFKTKPNYNDNELFCGGYSVQWQRNSGKCGVCGDPWHAPSPRANEAGGIYGRGIIVRNYSPGQVITSTVQITANHRGFFEFKMCPHNNPTTVVSQDCLDEHPLELADGSGTRYYPSFGTGPFDVQLRLPQQMTCSQCVFQWTYTAGNNWGQCEDGSSQVGCGPQETFRGCADVSVGKTETNDIPHYSYSPPRKTSPPKPSYQWSRPTKPARKKRPHKTALKPYYTNRGPINPRKQPTTKRPVWQNYPKRTYATSRPVIRPRYTSRPWYSSTPKKPSPWYYSSTPKRPTPYPKNTRKQVTPKPRSTKRPKPPRKQPIRPSPKPLPQPYEKESDNSVETGGCRAVGAWKSVSGIASWCNSNCPRGYCPPSHCDCS